MAATAENTVSDTRSDSNLFHWLILILAGLVEVGYAISVGGSEGFTNLSWSISALVFFLFTLFFLSVALRKIDVGIGYAVWVGIGAVGAVIASAFLFDEPVTFSRIFWLSIIIAGVVWLKVADSPMLNEADESATEAAHELRT
jgi:quaternary ammonium compound-resistance protein SugE